MSDVTSQCPTTDPSAPAAAGSSVLGLLLASAIGGLALGLLRWLPAAVQVAFLQRPANVSPALWLQMIASWFGPFFMASDLSAFGAVALVGLLLRKHPAQTLRLGLSTPLPRWSSLLSLGVAVVGVVALGIAASTGMARVEQVTPALGGLLLPTITPFWTGHPAIGLTFGIAVAPLAAVGEEVLYRGYVQRGLLERWSPLPAILLTATCSALARGWPDLSYALPMTLFLGWAAYRTNSTRASFVLHAAGNAVLYCLVLANGGWLHWMASMTNGTMVLLIVLGALAVTFGLQAFRRSGIAPMSTT